MTPVRLQPVALRSRVKPLRSLFTLYTIYHIPHARIQKGLSDNVFALVDEGREDPNTTARGPLGPGLLT